MHLMCIIVIAIFSVKHEVLDIIILVVIKKNLVGGGKLLICKIYIMEIIYNKIKPLHKW